MSPMLPPMGFPDGQLFDEGMAEAVDTFEERVQIKRFLSTTGGDPADGQAPTKNYTVINTTALIESLSAQELAGATAFYMAGDLRAQLRLQVYGAEGGGYDEPSADTGDYAGAGRRSDIVVYRNREYRVVGRVEKIHYAGQYYWSATLRQATS